MLKSIIQYDNNIYLYNISKEINIIITVSVNGKIVFDEFVNIF